MTHVIVANADSQYSVWPRDKRLPAGWHPTGFAGTSAQCLDRIGETWADLRPRPFEGDSDER
jgi:MbtH protein